MFGSLRCQMSWHHGSTPCRFLCNYCHPGHPLTVLHIAWTMFSAQIQDILADVWQHFPHIIIQKCMMTSKDFAFVLTRTCRLTSLCLGFVDHGLTKPLSSIFPTSNRPSLNSSGIALTSFHYFMEVGALSFLCMDAYVQGVKPMLRALQELRTRSVYSVIPEIQSLVDINGDTLRTLDAIFLCGTYLCFQWCFILIWLW